MNQKNFLEANKFCIRNQPQHSRHFAMFLFWDHCLEFGGCHKSSAWNFTIILRIIICLWIALKSVCILVTLLAPKASLSTYRSSLPPTHQVLMSLSELSNAFKQLRLGTLFLGDGKFQAYRKIWRIIDCIYHPVKKYYKYK